MSLFYRVFSSLATVPDPAGLEACLAGLGIAVPCSFSADEAGWYRADVAAGPGPAIAVERFGADEEGIRAELNAWAGYLELQEGSPHSQVLMERVIQSRQLFTIERPADPPDQALAERLCEALWRHLARVTDGLVQIDERGFFAADGALLVAEQ
jgi:hypothetical protein